MRPSFVGSLVILGSVIIACGQEGATVSSTSTSTFVATSTSTTLAATTTTLGALDTTTTTLMSLPNVLRLDGIGVVDFGAPENETIASVELMLGPPDRIVELPADCYLAVDQVQSREWDIWGLRLVFTDWGGTHEEPVATPLHLSDWEAIAPGLATTDGLGWGSTVADLRQIYPEVMIGINEFAPWYLVEAREGRLMGGFDWAPEDFVRALQTALNENGANIEVTGDYFDGPTQEALFDFMEDRGLEAHVVLSALNLPPDDVELGWMHAGTGPLCD